MVGDKKDVSNQSIDSRNSFKPVEIAIASDKNLLEVTGDTTSTVRSLSPIGVTSSSLRKRFSSQNSSSSPSSSIQVQTSFRSPEFSNSSALPQNRRSSALRYSQEDGYEIDSRLARPEVFMSTSSYGGTKKESKEVDLGQTERQTESYSSSKYSPSFDQSVEERSGGLYRDDDPSRVGIRDSVEDSEIVERQPPLTKIAEKVKRSTGEMRYEEVKHLLSTLKLENRELKERINALQKSKESVKDGKGNAETKAVQCVIENPVAQDSYSLEVQQLQEKNEDLLTQVEYYKSELESLKSYVGDSLPQKLLDDRQGAYRIGNLENENADLKRNAELLKIRIDSLNSILETQTSVLRSTAHRGKVEKDMLDNFNQENVDPNNVKGDGDKNEKLTELESQNAIRNELLDCWRKKVFALMVQMKTRDIVKKEEEYVEQRVVNEQKEIIRQLRDRLAIAKHSYNDKCAEMDLQASALRVAQMEANDAVDKYKALLKKGRMEAISVQQCELKMKAFREEFEHQSRALQEKLGQMELLSQRLDFAVGRMKIMKGLFEHNNKSWKDKYALLQEKFIESQNLNREIPENKNQKLPYSSVSPSSRGHEVVAGLSKTRKLISAVLEQPDAFGHDYYIKLFKQLMKELSTVNMEREYLNKKNEELAGVLDLKVQGVGKEYETKLKALDDRLKKEINHHASLKEEFDDVNSKYVVLQREHEEAEQLIAAQREKCNRLREEVAKTKRDSEKIAREQLREMRDQTDSEYQKLETTYNNLKKEHAKVSVNLCQVERQYAKHRQQIDLESKQRVVELENELAKAENQIDKISQERNTLLSAIREQARQAVPGYTELTASPKEVRSTSTSPRKVHLSTSEVSSSAVIPVTHSLPREPSSPFAREQEASKFHPSAAFASDPPFSSPEKSPLEMASQGPSTVYAKQQRNSSLPPKSDVKSTLEELQKLSSLLLEEDD